MVVGQGLKLVAIGLVAGAVLSFWVARALTSLLYQTEAHDTATFVSVPVVLALISLAACALPGLRASRVEPISSLRGD
jgi:ABC-type antimicrobial peptide transport system permease subunit